MFEIGDRVIYRQPDRIHSLCMPSGVDFKGTIISVCKTSSYTTYRIKLDVTWRDIGHRKYKDKNGNYFTMDVSHVTADFLDKNVIVGNINNSQIVDIEQDNLIILNKRL